MASSLNVLKSGARMKFFKMSGELAGMLDTSMDILMIFTGFVVRLYP